VDGGLSGDTEKANPWLLLKAIDAAANART